MKMGQSVPKRRHIKFSRRRFTHNKEYSKTYVVSIHLTLNLKILNIHNYKDFNKIKKSYTLWAYNNNKMSLLRQNTDDLPLVYSLFIQVDCLSD